MKVKPDMQKYNDTTRTFHRTMMQAFPQDHYEWFYPPKRKAATVWDWALGTAGLVVLCVAIYYWSK
jgi:hypothetical protein